MHNIDKPEYLQLLYTTELTPFGMYRGHIDVPM